MKILIDTNIILDLLCNRAAYAESASKVFKFCEVNQVEGFISALSVPNIVYIMRKELDEKRIGEIIQMLSSICTIADLKGSDMQKAAALPINDFEDALQSVCAARIHADFIVTRNLKDFRNSEVIAITPDDLLTRIAE